MKMIYKNVEIVEYHVLHTPSYKCYYYEQSGTDEGKLKEISYKEAYKLYWELKKLGGKSNYGANPFKPSVTFRQVTYFGPDR